jgi:hypothetical protein
MVAQIEAQILGYRTLPLFNHFIKEFLNSPAVYADDMVMVGAALQLENCLTALKVVPGDKSRSFELGKRTIHGGQPDLLSCIKQQSVDGLGGKVPIFRFFEKLKHFEARCCNFKAGVAQILAFHGITPILVCELAVIWLDLYQGACYMLAQSLGYSAFAGAPMCIASQGCSAPLTKA